MTTPGENCERHEREIERLREQHGEQRSALAVLAQRVPEDLERWMGEVSTTLKALSRGQDEVVEALRKGYVTVAELDALKASMATFVTKDQLETFKTEVRPVISTFWKAAGLIGLMLLTAVLGLLIRDQHALSQLAK